MCMQLRQIVSRFVQIRNFKRIVATHWLARKFLPWCFFCCDSCTFKPPWSLMLCLIIMSLHLHISLLNIFWLYRIALRLCSLYGGSSIMTKGFRSPHVTNGVACHYSCVSTPGLRVHWQFHACMCVHVAFMKDSRAGGSKARLFSGLLNFFHARCVHCYKMSLESA